MVAPTGPASLVACFAAQVALLVAVRKAGLTGPQPAAEEPPVCSLPAAPLDCLPAVPCEPVPCEDAVPSWLVWLFVVGALLAGIGASWVVSAVVGGPWRTRAVPIEPEDASEPEELHGGGPSSPVPLCWCGPLA